MTINYRAGGLDDLKACASLIDGVWPDEAALFADEYRLFLEKPDMFQPLAILAEDDAGRLAVDPDYRRQGIGESIMRRCLAEADRRGQGTVLSAAEPEWYDRFGYRNMGATGPEYHMLFRPAGG